MDWTMASPNPAWRSPERRTQNTSFPTCTVASRNDGRTYVVWAKQHLRNREAFVSHVKYLLAVNRCALRLAYVAVPIPREVRKHVFLDDRIPALIGPEKE